ncbi:MAG: amino acid permease [bacterium]|nr:amino acid permease [bacterium]
MKENQNHRELGLYRTTSLVVGNIIGTGIFMLPASLGAFGTLGLMGWMVTSVGSICLALVFARLARKMPRIGGPYAYSRAAFGDFVGFQMAWSYWIGTLASNAAISTAFVSYLSFLYPALKENNHLSFAVAFISVWAFTILNMSSVRNSGITQVVIVVLKVVPLCIIGIFGMFYINIENFFPVNPSNLSVFKGISSASALTLFAFLGLESATVPAENVINPEKNIPRATILGTVFSAIIYIWTTVVLMGILPAEKLAASNAPFADAAHLMMGNWAATAIAICAAFAAFGTLNGWIMLQGQIPVAAARDGLFPAILGKMSKRGTPAVSLFVSSVLMSFMLYMNYELPLVDQFTAIVTFTTFAVLLPYLYSTVAELVFLKADKIKMTKWEFYRSFSFALIGFVYTLLIVFGTGQKAVFLGIIFVFLGFPVYALIKKK